MCAALGAACIAPALWMGSSDIAAAAGTTASQTFPHSKLNPSSVGQNVYFTVRVRSGVGAVLTTPTGTVQWSVDAVNVGAPIPLVSGTEKTGIKFTTTGPHTVTANYSGDATFAPSAGSVVQTVNALSPQATTTTVTSSANPSVSGQAVKFTAKVAEVSKIAVPTGTVTFTVDGIAATPVALTSGAASTIVPNLAIGGHTVSAVYNGDATDLTSPSTVLNQTVNKGSTTTAVTSPTNPSPANTAVHLVAVISLVHPAKGSPTGTVTFSIDGVAQPPVAVAFGKATFNTAPLASGPHNIQATYNGDANFNASPASAVLVQTVS
jgi:hypothetical protein